MSHMFSKVLSHKVFFFENQSQSYYMRKAKTSKGYDHLRLYYNIDFLRTLI